MRELLPEGWRWFSACVQHSEGIKDNKLMLLGGSLLNRVTKALQARDNVHIALSVPKSGDTTDDALGSLDTVLVLLMGAVDASARVAHYILGLPPTTEYSAAWQSSRWRALMPSSASALLAVTDTATDGEHTLTILRLLRNSLHGVALQEVSLMQNGSRNAETLVGLPKDDEATILAAMDAMGGRASWGFRQIIPGKSHVEPAVLVDRLFEEVAKLLNGLMRETPVEILAHVTITSDSIKPPSDEPNKINVFNEQLRLAIRWQLGF